ncbi:hypothetical protein NBT05_03180 [Aquimarina sp. ERC-38]|uniref:hypothetical protein n=1 Tax=Aquimarina sp. ERC-38 TaxID=2949996 RepID=UPI002247670F|nr:hypothetical protein [Aquimarina sp. ERC-38]UZO81484.1 hypothetical protein NBT05_03180 [Aquimarina sp. ERC-38]
MKLFSINYKVLMDFYEKIIQIKKDNNLTYSDLGEPINLKGSALRMALKRKSLSDLQKRELNTKFTISNNTLDNLNDIESFQIKLKEFSDFFVKYESQVLLDPNIRNIIEKKVAKRLFEITRDKDSLKEFLDT